MLQNTINVSIITVSYNAVNTIEQTILSVLNQTYKNIEYIVIDGQSTDGTPDIIRKYQSSLSYFVSEPDDGLYYAMNKGIMHATGDIIGIINSDDWYEAEAVEKIVSCFMQSGAELVYGKKWIVGKDGQRRRSEKQPLENIWYTTVVPHSTVFVRRDIYQKYGAFNTNYKIAADYDLLLRFYTKGVKFEYLDEMISDFRYGGMSSTHFLQGAEEGKRISLSYIDQCPEKETVVKRIEKGYNIVKLADLMDRDPCIVGDVLKRRLLNIQAGVIIFGTGVWGKRLQRILNETAIPIQMFVDNNEEKWGKETGGIIIHSPEVLRKGTGCVLIAVREYTQEICRQLETLNNERLVWISLDELQEWVMEGTYKT